MDPTLALERSTEAGLPFVITASERNQTPMVIRKGYLHPTPTKLAGRARAPARQ